MSAPLPDMPDSSKPEPTLTDRSALDQIVNLFHHEHMHTKAQVTRPISRNLADQ